MATAAQIEANRLNARKSTGPKTERGKARAKLNAVTHGMSARTIMPVLPQEDPKEVEDKTQQAITAMKPRNPLEHDLVCRAVRLSGELDRAERVATAHLAHRVRMATRSGPETVSACELKEVHELGSKLFFQAGIGLGYPDSTGDDYPAVIVRRLEENTEGCRWLLARWAELRNVLDRKAAWDYPEILRFAGLQGKRTIEAHFDPDLNSLFHAFDALGNRIGHKFWKDWRDMLPVGYKGGFMNVPYREIAPAPSDETAALTLIRSVIERHVGRLEELLAEHEGIEAEEAAERYDRAALDCSPAFERHRRYQSARHRELLRTLETLRKMRKEEFGTGNGEGEKADGKCQMADGKCRMADDRGQRADDRCRTADDGCEVRSGGCGDAENGLPTPQAPSEDGVASGEWRVASEIGVASGTGIVVSSQWSVVSESGGSGEPTQEECRAPQNVQNEANPELTQSSLPLEVESSATEPEGRKRSQWEGDNAPRSTLHAPRLTPIVGSESGGSGERRVESGDCGEDEPERSEPTQEECRAPENAPNEAKLESTQNSLPPMVKSSENEPAGRERSQSSAGGAVPHDTGDELFDNPIARARANSKRARGSKSESGERRENSGQWPVTGRQ
ncbi:MAG: hypothetical protein ABSH35_24325 [Isosphaeraceae bacterium]